MHTVHQGKYGDRFANLKPATVPSAIASLVRTASLSNVVVVRTKVDQAKGVTAADDGRVITPPAHIIRPGIKQAVRTDATNVLSDPGFESGGFTYWPQCGNANASITTAKPHTGSYSERSGTTTTEPNGDAGVCQQVTIPASGQLTFWVWQSTNETSTAFSYQEADLLDSTGAVIDNLYTTVSNAQAWVQKSYNLSAYAGQSVYLYFGVHGDGTAGYHNLQYVDDVSLTSGSATPTPTPTPGPDGDAQADADADRRADADAGAHRDPRARPRRRAAAATARRPTTARSRNSSGTLATGIAKPFDFPVQHGCNGAGYTAAVVIDDPVSTSYVHSYLTAAGVTQTGTITNTAVDGGGSGDDPETDLDVQTISGLAPGANIIVYHIGSLTDQAIEDAYNKAISDGKASVVNSSFGGCESSDTPFESSTNSIAQQGAAVGVTFAASSGDTGSNECNGTKGVSAPAGDPYFTSVGGVNFTYNSLRRADVRHHGRVQRRLRRRRRLDGRPAPELPERRHRHDHERPQPARHLAAVRPGRGLHGRSLRLVPRYVVVFAASRGAVRRNEPVARHEARLGQPDDLQPVQIDRLQHLLHALHLRLQRRVLVQCHAVQSSCGHRRTEGLGSGQRPLVSVAGRCYGAAPRSGVRLARRFGGSLDVPEHQNTAQLRAARDE